jgi:hypothetical protein
MVRPSWWMLLTCRGGAFLKQINQGYDKLKMRLDLAKFLEE